MNIKEFDYSTEYGFAWIILEDGTSVQCCLYQPNGTPAERKLIMSDCGHDCGICGEVNEPAFTRWGENRCMKALFTKAKENGIEVTD